MTSKIDRSRIDAMAEDAAKTNPSEDAKARMRELLERKKQGGNHGPSSGVAGKGGVAAAHEKAGGKREFRRKSS